MFVCEKVHYTIDYYSYYRSRNIIKTSLGKNFRFFPAIKIHFCKQNVIYYSSVSGKERWYQLYRLGLWNPQISGVGSWNQRRPSQP